METSQRKRTRSKPNENEECESEESATDSGMQTRQKKRARCTSKKHQGAKLTKKAREGDTDDDNSSASEAEEDVIMPQTDAITSPREMSIEGTVGSAGIEAKDPDLVVLEEKKLTWTSDVYKHYHPAEIACNSKGKKLYAFDKHTKQMVLQYAFRCKTTTIIKKRKITDSSTGNLKKHSDACNPTVNSQSVDVMEKYVGGYTRERLRWLIVRWITSSNRPFAIVEDPDFIEIVKLLNSKAVVPTAMTVSRDLKTVHDMMKEKLIAMFKMHEGAVHVAVDAWSSKKSSSYLGITIQFCASDSMELTKLTLGFVRVPLSHTGRYLAEQIYNVLDELGLSSKLIGLAGDNASNNDTMTDALAHLIPSWGGQTFRIRCFAHIINLVEQAFLSVFRTKKGERAHCRDSEPDGNMGANDRLLTKLEVLQEDDDEEDEEYEKDEDPAHQQLLQEEIDELDIDSVRTVPPLTTSKKLEAQFVLSKATGLSKHVAKSDTVQTSFVDCCNYVQIKPLMLKRPVATRWNTHFECLERHLQQKLAVVRLCESPAYSKFNLDKYVLSDVEWEVVEQLKPVLELFQRIMKHISQSGPVLVHQVLPIIDKLTGDLEDILQDETMHIAIRHGAKWALGILDKYYTKTDDSYIYRVAMILHPRYKTEYFETSDWEQSWIDEALKITRRLWKKYKSQDAPRITEQIASLTEFEWFEKKKKSTNSQAPPEDDLARYLRKGPDGGCLMPLAYWHGQLASGLSSPQLVRFAKDILSCPATSVDVERLFSLSGKTISPVRNALSDESVRHTLLLNSWMKIAPLSVQEEFTDCLIKGWKRGKNRREHNSLETHAPIIVND